MLSLLKSVLTWFTSLSELLSLCPDPAIQVTGSDNWAVNEYGDYIDLREYAVNHARQNLNEPLSEPKASCPEC